jgi:hypothetical protein
MKLVAASVALALAVATPVAAERPEPPCAAIVDDQRGLVEMTTGAPWRDLRGAAIGSNGTHVTAVIALSALPTTPSTPDHAAVDYTMRFTVGGATAFLTAPAHEDAAASYGVDIAYRPVVLGEATVVRDRELNQLRVTAPIAAFAPLADLRPGGTATNLNAMVAVTPGIAASSAVARPQTVIVDGASGKATYELGTRSCVPVGG